MKSYSSVEHYISSQSPEIREGLEKIRRTILKAAPGAEEVISYGMPAYKLNGILVYFASFKDHYSFFPTGRGVEKFKSKLKAYELSKGTIHLPFEKPLPLKLISEIVKFRVKDNLSKTLLKKKTGKKGKAKK
jgi:uncharacterized protein YdhG (YjbR/CyaY superfamily)